MSSYCYHLFSDDGRLLYVGATSKTPRERLHQHRVRQSWSKDVAFMRVFIHATREAAFRQENADQERLRPLYCGRFSRMSSLKLNGR